MRNVPTVADVRKPLGAKKRRVTKNAVYAICAQLGTDLTVRNVQAMLGGSARDIAPLVNQYRREHGHAEDSASPTAGDQVQAIGQIVVSSLREHAEAMGEANQRIADTIVNAVSRIEGAASLGQRLASIESKYDTVSQVLPQAIDRLQSMVDKIELLHARNALAVSEFMEAVRSNELHIDTVSIARAVAERLRGEVSQAVAPLTSAISERSPTGDISGQIEQLVGTIGEVKQLATAIQKTKSADKAMVKLVKESLTTAINDTQFSMMELHYSVVECINGLQLAKDAGGLPTQRSVHQTGRPRPASMGRDRKIRRHQMLEKVQAEGNTGLLKVPTKPKPAAKKDLKVVKPKKAIASKVAKPKKAIGSKVAKPAVTKKKVTRPIAQPIKQIGKAAAGKMAVPKRVSTSTNTVARGKAAAPEKPKAVNGPKSAKKAASRSQTSVKKRR